MRTERTRPIRVLFLSDESSHDKIFLKIVYELKKVSNVWFKILDSNRLLTRTLSIRFSYKQELHHFAQIVDQAQPDVFVVANDQGISATFIRICKLRGIPSLAIQDGILTNKKLEGPFRFLAWKRYLPWRIISMEGFGPSTRIPKKTNLIIVGKKPVSVDIVAAEIIGVSWKKVKHLAFAASKSELGSSNIKAIGDDISDVKGTFILPKKPILRKLLMI